MVATKQVLSSQKIRYNRNMFKVLQTLSSKEYRDTKYIKNHTKLDEDTISKIIKTCSPFLQLVKKERGRKMIIISDSTKFSEKLTSLVQNGCFDLMFPIPNLAPDIQTGYVFYDLIPRNWRNNLKMKLEYFIEEGAEGQQDPASEGKIGKMAEIRQKRERIQQLRKKQPTPKLPRYKGTHETWVEGVCADNSTINCS